MELNIGGIWAPVNEQGWDIRDGNVACRQLGFAGAHGVSVIQTGNHKKWFSNLKCVGNETSLGKCNHTLMQYSWYQRDAGVECYGNHFYPFWMCFSICLGNNHLIGGGGGVNGGNY